MLLKLCKENLQGWYKIIILKHNIFQNILFMSNYRLQLTSDRGSSTFIYKTLD